MLCETCLGPNPYVRMSKLPWGYKLCKISNLPYQAFKWKAGPGGRYKETMVCYVVAAERNICQTCLLDMKYGLPVGVRDSLLSQAAGSDKPSIPQSNVGQQYYYEQQALLIQDGQLVGSNSSQHLDLSNIVASRQLDRFSKVQHHQGVGAGAALGSSKTAFRNLPKLCSFWLNGTCSRVLQRTCPFRPCCGEDSFVFPEIAGSHRELCAQLVSALKTDGPAKVMKALDRETRDAIAQAQKGNRDDAIRRRVSGDDDLTKKYLGKMKSMSLKLEPPSDATILTLWLGNVEPEVISEDDIRSVIYPYGQVSSIHLVRSAKCAFVEYLSREEAEFAASQLYNSLVVNGRPLTVSWARPRKQEAAAPEESQSSRAALPPPPGMEMSHPTTYSLPDLPVPTVTWSKPGLLHHHSNDNTMQPPPPPPPGSSAKRSRDSMTASLVVPASSSGSALSYFSAYGDDDDDDDDRPAAAAVREAPQPKRPQTSAAAYPSMNPARMGSSLL